MHESRQENKQKSFAISTVPSLIELLPSAINDKSGHAEYRRPNNGILKLFVKTSMANSPLYVSQNQDIVPYNPYLFLRYECHICVHVVTSATIVQYVYKYITKNAAFTRMKIGTAISEIE